MTPEQQQRIEDIGKRREALKQESKKLAWDVNPFNCLCDEACKPFMVNAPKDIDFLLSVVKEQEAEGEARPKCSGCHEVIDPDVCWCGLPEKQHGQSDNHGFIPMGCACYRDKLQSDVFARQVLKRISDAALELAFVRHDLSSDEFDESDYPDTGGMRQREQAQEQWWEGIKEDTLNCLTGDDFGCLDPEELDESNCELLFLQTVLRTQRTSMRSACVQKVKSMRDENQHNYEYWKSISSNPETDFGVLKWAAWRGEDERVITALESVSIQEQEAKQS